MYKSTITAMGHMAMDFLDQNMLILFNDNAPEELAEIAVLHRAAPLEGTIEEGDIVTLGPDQFVIRAVGDQVNHTFSTMGHCTLMFNGQKEASLPGAIELSGRFNTTTVACSMGLLNSSTTCPEIVPED